MKKFQSKIFLVFIKKYFNYKLVLLETEFKFSFQDKTLYIPQTTN